MKPACWEACFLYPCPTVEHSNNCLLLLCVLFLKPSGHYTKKVEMPGGKGRVNISNNYVAPSDGWVRLQVNGTGNGSYIQLLSSDGYANTVIGFSSGNVVNGMLPLRKGATFTYVLGECTLSAAQFYPC